MATTNVPAAHPALQQMADIQEPALASDWYMAPIWWLLLLLIILLVAVAVRYYRRRQQKLAPVRFALSTLSAINPENTDAVFQITALLKRLLLTQAPAHPALSYSGAAWQQFLTASLEQRYQQPLPDLLALHYQPNPAVADVALYAGYARAWLQHAKPLAVLPANHAGASDV